jgi:hypothetical protein
MPHRGLGKRLKKFWLARLTTRRQLASVSGRRVDGFPFPRG